jgi:Icc-related predicted phosphoesterase
MKIDCVSDLHGYYPDLEGGDMLIIAGDLSAYGRFEGWLQRQNYKKKILIAGNHDNYYEWKGFEVIQDIYKSINIDYLCDSGMEFEGLKIWGSPWTKTFPRMNRNCKAFTREKEDELMNKWDLIPDDIDILITHSPAHGVLDGVDIGIGDGTLYHTGSRTLYNTLTDRVHPRLHVCGHIHEGYGQEEYFPTYLDNMTISVNASVVNERYEHVNKPIRVIL